MEAEKFDDIVVGAGISGLAAAYQAKKIGRSVLLLENSPRAGGVIESEKDSGYLLEHGPNTVLLTPELFALIKDLGLESSMRLADVKIPRFILFRKKLYQVPLSPQALLTTKLLSLPGKVRLLMEPFIKRGPLEREESVFAFGERRLGSEATERLLSPFISGVWAGDAQKLSVNSAFPKLIEWEREQGSLLKGSLLSAKKRSSHFPAVPRGLMSFENGLETLVNKLVSKVGGALRLNTTATSLQFSDNASHPWSLSTAIGESQAKRIFLAPPNTETNALLKSVAPEIEDSLLNIPYAPVIILHLGFKNQPGVPPPHGFGYLIPPSEREPILGCLWTSAIFTDRAPKDHSLFTVFMGGTRKPEMIDMTDEELLSLAVDSVQRIQGITESPHFYSITRYEAAIPQYTIGHSKRIQTLKETERKFPGLKFIGNYMAGISVGDVVKYAMESVNL